MGRLRYRYLLRDQGADLLVLGLARHALHLDQGVLLPALDLAGAPLDKVVHVLKELIPGHHTRRGIRGHEALALGALRVRASGKIGRAHV